MIKTFPLLLLTLLMGSCNNQPEAAAAPDALQIEPAIEKSNILFVTTNVDEMKGAPNGTYLVELAVPFDIFTKAGYNITIISPLGGAIPIYHSGDTVDIVRAIINSELYKRKTENTLRPNEVNAEEYLAVIIPGGYGQFWDTHKNKEILQIIADIHESGGIVGSLGHGTATLIDVKLKSGDYLVKDKTMTSFPTWAEQTYMEHSDYGKVLPYDMEEELLNRGANLQVYDPEQKINYEIVDAKNRLVTASFADGGFFVAEEVLKLINQKE